MAKMRESRGKVSGAGGMRNNSEELATYKRSNKMMPPITNMKGSVLLNQTMDQAIGGLKSKVKTRDSNKMLITE